MMLDWVYGTCAVCLTTVVVYAVLRTLRRTDKLAEEATVLIGRGNALAKRADDAMEEAKGVPKDAARVTAAVAGIAEHAAERIHRWLGGKAARAEERLRELENSVRQIQATQALGFCTHLRRGLSTLRRWDASGRTDTDLLVAVRDNLRDGLSDLELYVRATEPQLLLQHSQVSKLMLELLRQAAEVEVHVLEALGRSEESGAAVGDHIRLRTLWMEKLAELGDLRSQVLSPAVRRGCDGKPGEALEELQLAAEHVGERNVYEIKSPVSEHLAQH